MKGLATAGVVLLVVVAATFLLTPRTTAATKPVPKPAAPNKGKGFSPAKAKEWASAANDWAGVFHQFQGVFGGNPNPPSPSTAPGIQGEVAGTAYAAQFGGLGGFAAGASSGALSAVGAA